jgi:hypothetical protein
VQTDKRAEVPEERLEFRAFLGHGEREKRMRRVMFGWTNE